MFKWLEGNTEFQFYWLWVLIGWLLIFGLIYFSLMPSPPEVFEFAFADKLKHFLAYGVLMSWFAQLYPTIKRQLFWAIAFCSLGVTMEFAQGWGGQRTFDVFDMLANGCGVLLGWWLVKNWLSGSLLHVDHTLSRWLGKA